jgi:FOG: Ankyrin repeat
VMNIRLLSSLRGTKSISRIARLKTLKIKLYTMKKVIIILSIFALVVSNCGQRNTKKNEEEKITEISDVYQQLIKAIETDDSNAFDKLINHITNIDTLIQINEDDDDFYTLIGGYDFYTLIGFACRYKRCHFVEKLINLNADIATGVSDEIFVTGALSVAIASQDMCSVKLLLNNGADPNRRVNESGFTVLSLSCMVNNYDIAKLLIESGADVNGLGDLGFEYVHYPLLQAVRSNNIKIVQLFIDNNCKIDVRDTQDETPFKVAERNENQEILDLLMKAQGIKNIYPQLIKAIKTDDKSTFDKLINHIPNIDSLIQENKNDNFYTLLGFACKYKRCHFVEQLINLNANVGIGESDEIFVCDALSVAVESEDMCLVKLLLNNGAKPNRWNSETGCTVLSISCMLNNYDISKLLIESGAKVDGLGDTGFGYINYPLLHAIGSNNIKLVQLLIDNNCTIDINDNQGDTPFTIAERNENQEILDLLKKAQEERMNK